MNYAIPCLLLAAGTAAILCAPRAPRGAQPASTAGPAQPEALDDGAFQAAELEAPECAQCGVSHARTVAFQGALELRCTIDGGGTPLVWPRLQFVEDHGESYDLAAAPDLQIQVPADGGLTVSITSEGWVTEPVRLEAAALRTGAPLELLLIPANRYSGLALDAETFAPLEQVRLTAEYTIGAREGAPVSAFYELPRVELESGAFDLIGIPAQTDRLRLHLEADGYRSVTTEWLPNHYGVHVASLLLELPPRGDEDLRLAGAVRDGATGLPIPGALVRLVPQEVRVDQLYYMDGDFQFPGTFTNDPRQARARARSGPDGEFLVETEDPHQRLLCWREGYRPLLTAPLSTLGEASLELALERGVSLSGRLLAPELSPEELAAHRVHVRGPGARWAVAPDTDGRFHLEGLDEAVYRLIVRAPAGDLDQPEASLPTWSGQVAARAGADELEILIGAARPGAALQGELIAPTDLGIERWQVVACQGPVLGEGIQGHAVLREGETTFTLSGLPDGETWVLLYGQSGEGRQLALSYQVVHVAGDRDTPLLFDLSQSRVEVVGLPSADASVPSYLRLEGEDLDPRLAEFFQDVGSLRSDPGQQSLVIGLPAGRYRLVGAELEERFTISAAEAHHSFQIDG